MSNKSENKNENEYMRLLKAVDDGIDHVEGKYDISDLSVTWDDDTFFVAYLRPDIVHAISDLFPNASE